ncbi:MAG: T9SS type A sorting domain-containing protein [Chitinophagales bacterium]
MRKYLQNLPSHTTTWQQYKDLALIAIDLQQSGIAYSNMNSTQEQKVRNIAATNTVYANHAKGILYQAFGENYAIDSPVFPSQSSKRASTLKGVITENILQLMPNPANSYLQIRWNNPTSEASLHIYNAVGKKLEQYKVQNGEGINIHHLANGIYICALEIEGKIWTHQKLVVNH